MKKMKKSVLILVFVFSTIQLTGQVFNSAEILKPGRFSVGINPTDVEKELALFLYGGYGLTRKIDLSVRYGFLEGNDYIGADVEWAIKDGDGYDISLFAGAHDSGAFGPDIGEFGLDIGIIASILIGKHAIIYSGLDSDIYFDFNDTRNFWIPLGVEINWKDNISLIIEADIPASEWAPHIFGGGVGFYIP